MRCSDFLANYSDLRDRAPASPGLRSRLVGHMAVCPRCARYHDVIERGVSRLRSTERVEPSGAFRAGLRRRIAAAVIEAPPLFPVPIRFVGSLIIAVAVATLLVAGFVNESREPGPLPAPGRPMPMVQANPGPPFVTFADLNAPISFGQAVSFQAGRKPPVRPYVTFADTIDPD